MYCNFIRSLSDIIKDIQSVSHFGEQVEQSIPVCLFVRGVAFETNDIWRGGFS